MMAAIINHQYIYDSTFDNVNLHSVSTNWSPMQQSEKLLRQTSPCQLDNPTISSFWVFYMFYIYHMISLICVCVLQAREAARKEMERQRQAEWERQRKHALLSEKKRHEVCYVITSLFHRY